MSRQLRTSTMWVTTNYNGYAEPRVPHNTWDESDQDPHGRIL